MRRGGRSTRARRAGLLPFLLLVLGLLHVPVSSVAAQALAAGPTAELSRDGEVPDKAREVLAEIQKRKGEAPPGYVGGRVFSNREGRLPRGRYREYDVNPKRAGKSRGTERIVIEQRTGRAYYTRDHYETFAPMN
jgi:ribonuclease T1